MKLLSRSEITENKLKEQKSEVDTAKFLASSVDTLRQKLAVLQQEEHNFISTTKQRVHTEISKAQEKLNLLNDEVLKLSIKKENALKVVVERESKVKEKEESLKLAQNDLYSRLNEIKNLQNSLKSKEKTLGSLIESHEQKNKQVSISLENQIQLERQAQKTLAELHEEKRSFDSYKETMLLSLKEKERVLANEIRHYKDFLKESKKNQ